MHHVWHAVGDPVDVCLKIFDGTKDTRMIIRVYVNLRDVLLIGDDEIARVFARLDISILSKAVDFGGECK
jgi:hypothetical protein